MIAARPQSYDDGAARPQACLCGRLVTRRWLCRAWHGGACAFGPSGPVRETSTLYAALLAQPDREVCE